MGGEGGIFGAEKPLSAAILLHKMLYLTAWIAPSKDNAVLPYVKLKAEA